MEFHFDLTEEPWIPAVALKDNQDSEYNLRDIILQAHNLSEIYCSSPLVSVSLYRLLLAILHRCCPLQSQREWYHLWEQGCFPENGVGNYLRSFKDRFDLFSDTHPFYQTADLELDTRDGLNRLATELASGNNATLFDHTLDSSPISYSPAQAARLVAACQSYSFAGLLRRTARLKGEEFYWQNSYNSVLLPGTTIWLTGNSLFETLMLNFIPSRNDPVNNDDLPPWERDRPYDDRARIAAGKPVSPPTRGPVDRLTWQSRLLRLLPERENNITSVRYVYFTQGRSPDVTPNTFDPMQTYYQDEKRGWLVFRLSREKAIWRDAQALLGLDTPAKKTPDAYNLVSGLIQTERIHRDRRYSLHVAGLASDQAKVYLWRHDRLNLPAALLVDPDLIERLEKLDAAGLVHWPKKQKRMDLKFIWLRRIKIMANWFLKKLKYINPLTRVGVLKYWDPGKFVKNGTLKLWTRLLICWV